MSGISTGSIFFTPAMMMIAASNVAENMAKAAGRCVFAGAIAIHNYNKKQEQKKIDGLSKEIDALNKSVRDNIYTQTEKFDNSISELTESLKELHSQSVDFIKNSTADSFKNFLRESEKSTLAKIEKMNADFQKSYHDMINRSNSDMITRLSSLRETVLRQSEKIQQDEKAKALLAKSRAEELIGDALRLSQQLGTDTADKYIRQAQNDILIESYQSAISLATSAITEIYMEHYRSDAEEKEKIYYKSSIAFMIAEVREYADFIKEVEYREEEEKTVTLDLTDFMEGNDKTIMDRISEIESYTDRDISVSELKEMIAEISNLRHEFIESVSDAFYLMTYSLNRMKAERNIYNTLTGKGFELKKTLYTDGDPVKASERTYKCALTGEELVISMIPYTDDEDEIKTQIIIENNDVECSEESREQYRKDIIERLKTSCREIESVNIKCREDTRNKNASTIEKKERISNPQKIVRRQR